MVGRMAWGGSRRRPGDAFGGKRSRREERSVVIEVKTKEELHHLVETLSEQAAAEVLDHVHWLQEEPESLTPEEIERVRQGEEQIARGEYVTLEQLRHDLGV